MPYLYEENLEHPYTERGIENACRHLDFVTPNEDLATIYKATANLSHEESLKWINKHKGQFSNDTLIINSGYLEPHTPKKGLLLCTEPFNEIRYFNDFLLEANRVLSDGGILALCGETSGMRRHRMKEQYPPVISGIKIIGDYIWGVSCQSLP